MNPLKALRNIHRASMSRLVNTCLVMLLVANFGSAQELQDQVTSVTLENGLRVIMVAQDSAPVIYFNLMFDVGGIDEPDGLGGLAHMVEHMAFKGTETIGDEDLVRELEVLEDIEVLVAAIDQAESAGFAEDEIAKLEANLTDLRAEAETLASPNALDTLFDANGAVGLNASTGYDFTSYVVALPSNRLELYARVYADILLEPVFRSFYEERDVVMEERRQRSEDDPRGVLVEAFLDAAFEAHPYGRPLIGSPQEIEDYRATEAEAFFELYYHPNRAVLVMVGDVDPERDLEVIEQYFGVVPAGPDFRRDLPTEPTQTEELRVDVPFDAEPQLYIGYHKPTYPDREAYVLDVISGVLSSGRTSRLYRRMVLEDQIAVSAGAGSSFPGSREPNLFVLVGSPRFPATPTDLETAFYEELERLTTEPVSERELTKVKNQVRAGFIRGLASGSGLASQLAFYELFLGGWENLEGYAETIESVTAEEIMAVASEIFVPTNRTVGTLVTTSPDETEASSSEEGAGQ